MPPCPLEDNEKKKKKKKTVAYLFYCNGSSIIHLCLLSSIDHADRAKVIVAAFPFWQSLDGVLQLFDGTVFIDLKSQDGEQPDPVQEDQIRVGNGIPKVMSIVTVVAQPPFMALKELRQSVGHEI